MEKTEETVTFRSGYLKNIYYIFPENSVLASLPTPKYMTTPLFVPKNTYLLRIYIFQVITLGVGIACLPGGNSKIKAKEWYTVFWVGEQIIGASKTSEKKVRFFPAEGQLRSSGI